MGAIDSINISREFFSNWNFEGNEKLKFSAPTLKVETQSSIISGQHANHYTNLSCESEGS